MILLLVIENDIITCINIIIITDRLMAVHGNNNLPTFEEDSVTGDIACLISTGNQSVYITQKHNSDSFYVVIYDTS